MIDTSFIEPIVPVVAFLLVSIVVGGILYKTELLGKNSWLIIFVALSIASIFISMAGAINYVTTVVPWAAALLVSLFLLMLFMGFIGKPVESFYKGVGLVFILLLGLIFLISAFVVFSDVFSSYIPGPSYGKNADPAFLVFVKWFFTTRIFGALILLALSGLVSWILIKAK